MRSAEEIMDKNLGGNFIGDNTRSSVIDAINEARKEAIEECSKRAATERVYESYVGYLSIVNKQSILSLIEELK